MGGRKAKELTPNDITEIRASEIGIEKLSKLYGIGNRRIMAIKAAATFEEAMEFANGEPPKEKREKEGGSLTRISQPSNGAIVFTLGQHRISLNPQHLYDAYLYYEDIKVRHGVEEEFSEAIKVAMKYVWEQLNRQKAMKEEGKITIDQD
jgi:hypothetical protein